jgi:hypothetical protein
VLSHAEHQKHHDNRPLSEASEHGATRTATTRDRKRQPSRAAVAGVRVGRTACFSGSMCPFPAEAVPFEAVVLPLSGTVIPPPTTKGGGGGAASNVASSPADTDAIGGRQGDLRR